MGMPRSLRLQLSSKWGRRLERTLRPVRVIGVLELHRNGFAAIGQLYLLEDLRKGIRFKDREVTTFLSLFRGPAEKLHPRGIVPRANGVFHVSIRPAFIQFVIESRDDVLPCLIENWDAVRRSVRQILRIHSDGVVNDLRGSTGAHMYRAVIPAQTLR